MVARLMANDTHETPDVLTMLTSGVIDVIAGQAGAALVAVLAQVWRAHIVASLRCRGSQWEDYMTAYTSTQNLVHVYLQSAFTCVADRRSKCYLPVVAPALQRYPEGERKHVAAVSP